MKKNLLSSFMLFAAATLFMSCTDPAPVPTPPEPEPPVPTTDVTLDAKHAFGSYNEDGKKEGYANFVVALSEVEGSHDLVFKAAGKALVLNLYAPISETMDLPVGKYTSLTDVATVAGPSVVANLTNGFTIDAEKKSTKTHSFKSMELNVTRTGDLYTITFSGVTTGDTKYTCTYTAGKLDMTDITAEPEPDPDPESGLTNVVTYEVIEPGQPAYYQLVMTDCTLDKDGNPTSAGTKYIVDLYSTQPTDAVNWRPAAGVYNHTQWSDLIANKHVPNTFYREGSTTMSIVEKDGGTFDVDWDTAKNMMEGTVTIAHVGENGFTAVLNVKLGDAMDATVPLTPLELTATDFKRVNKNVDPEPEPAIDIKYSYVEYYGGAEASKYVLFMTDCTVTGPKNNPTSAGAQYTVELYSAKPTDPKNWRPAAGEYTVANTGAIGTVKRNESSVVLVDNSTGVFKPNWGTQQAPKSGTVTIVHEEGSATGFTATLDVILMDDATVKFTTAIEFERFDESGGGGDPEPEEYPQTTFTGDVTLALDATTAKAEYKNLEDGARFWNVTIGNNNTNYTFSMRIYGEQESTDLPDDMFMAGGAYEFMLGTFEPGTAIGAEGEPTAMDPTSYEDFTDQEKEQYAAIVDGSITIKKDTNGKYKFDFDVADEAGHKFTGTWTGAVDIIEKP